jgi:succinate dehydrogenase flavin-adding protein (antitoxin of CptAB toxin-antitoxin module)
LNDLAIQAVIEASLPRLQDAQDHGLLKAVIVSTMPPVDAATAWTTLAPDSDGLHVSPGALLVGEYGEGLAGQARPRLMAAGFTPEEAGALVDGGIRTLEQVGRAIDLRRIFSELPWALIAKDVLEEAPLDDRQRMMANQLNAGAWKYRPDASLAGVRRGLTPVQRATVFDDLVPRDAQPLLSKHLVYAHFRKVTAWLRELELSAGEPLSVFATVWISSALLRAAQGMPRHLQSVMEAVDNAHSRHREPSTVVESSPWAPRSLRAVASLAPVRGAAAEVVLDAPLHFIFSTYERLLQSFDDELRKSGHREEDVMDALRPRYLDLAVMRAAVTGHQLRLQVPLGDSPRELAWATMIEKRFPALQEAEWMGLLDVTIASSMPPATAPQPWATELVDGKTWYLSPEIPLEDAWREGQTGQAIPRLMGAGYGEADARALHALGVGTLERVAHAIALRDQFGAMPSDVIAKEVVSPLPHAQVARFWLDMTRHVSPKPAELLQTIRDNRVPPLRELWFDTDFFPSEPHAILEGVADESALPTLIDELRQSLSRLKLEPTESVETVARHLLGAARGDEAELSRALLHVQWWHLRRLRDLTVVESTPWNPERLRGFVSLDPADGSVAEMSKASVVVLQTFERLLERMDAELLKRGHDKAEVMGALGPQYLRLAALRAAASGRQLRLHVPTTSSPEDQALRFLIEAKLPFLERARSDGVLDVAIASSKLFPGLVDVWRSEVVNGDFLHVSADRPLQDAWNEGLSSHPNARPMDRGPAESEAPEQTLDASLSPLAAEPGFDLQDLLAQARAGLTASARTLQLCLVDPIVYPLDLIEAKRVATFESQVLVWLKETQEAAGQDEQTTSLSSFVPDLLLAATGDTSALIRPLGLAWGRRLLHRGQATVVEQAAWVPERWGRFATLVPSGGGGEGAGTVMAASDYIVLRTFKRLLDALDADLLASGRGEEAAMRSMAPQYFRLLALCAAASGQRLEILMPQESSAEADCLRELLYESFEPLEAARLSGLIDVSFKFESLTDAADGRAASDPADLWRRVAATRYAGETSEPMEALAGAAWRQANLLKQLLAVQQPEDFSGISSFGLPWMISPRALLAASP